VWSSRLRTPSKQSDDPRLQDGKYFEKILYHSVDVDVLTGQVNLSLPVVRLHILPGNHELNKNMRGDVEKGSRLPGGSWAVLYFVPELAEESASHAKDESRTYVLRPIDKSVSDLHEFTLLLWCGICPTWELLQDLQVGKTCVRNGLEQRIVLSFSHRSVSNQF
jgi:hypothetical protein